jgi:hypothetical protein
MADNPTPPSGKLPPLKQSSPAGFTGLTTKLPKFKALVPKIVVRFGGKKAAAGEPAPALVPPGAAPLATPPVESANSAATPDTAKAMNSPGAKPMDAAKPPPLPPRQVTPAAPPSLSPQPRLSTTTVVQLPPKTAASALVSLAGKPLMPLPGRAPSDSQMGVVPPIMPKQGNPTKAELRKTGIIRLNTPTAEETTAAESILLRPGETPEHVEPKSESAARPLASPLPNAITPQAPLVNAAPPLRPAAPPASAPGQTPAPKREGWKSLEPGELPPRPGGPVRGDVFARTQRVETPPPVAPVPAPSEKPATAPPGRVEASPKAGPTLNPAPVVLAPAAPAIAPSQPMHVAPPMVERGGGPVGEKLPAPHQLPEAKKDEPPPLQRAPAMLPTEDAPKPLAPPALPAAKAPESALKKPAQPTPGSTQSLKVAPPDVRPALKPAVLPKRSMPIEPAPAAAVPIVAEAKVGGVAPPSSPLDGPVKGAEVKSVVGAETKVAAKDAMTGRVLSGPVAAAIAAAEAKAATRRLDEPAPAAKTTQIKPATKPKAAAVKPSVTAPPLPATRAERSRKRKLRDVIIFWVLVMPLVTGGLVFGLLHFGRDTRVEGQVIPPDGMALNNELWIVSDFRELASGIAEDLAAERAPLMQEIQERRDHVQRAQADVAAREERIRLIQDQIRATKDDVNGIVKQSRDATQKIWDGEGASIDNEYQARLDGLKSSIANRARTLNLKYTPDETYESPEVWANAYRLALYQVPSGVDSVKEYTWLNDQMKAWRDFQKTLDTRKEQLREKAAAVKLEPAPKIADLNAKIDDLNQRIESTQAEEVPLKAELETAKNDLAQAETADTTLDDKYYKQLDSLPGESVTKHIPIRPNGRFTWVDDDLFAEGQTEHHYWIFARAVRADGRQYWALQNFKIPRNKTVEMTFEPTAFLSTKAILRPNLSPDEQEQ